MRILVVGGTGTIGKMVVQELAPRHEVVVAGMQNAEIKVDISDKKSIEKMYQNIGNIDAVVATTGKVHFGPFQDLSEEDYALGLENKLMGQVNLVSVGMHYMNDGGSFTLTSGVLNRDPIRFGACAAMVNGAIDGFITGAAIEMPRGIRINAVSPTVVTESMENYAEFFRGFVPVSVAQVAQAYLKSVEGAQTGQIYCVY